MLARRLIEERVLENFCRNPHVSDVLARPEPFYEQDQSRSGRAEDSRRTKKTSLWHLGLHLVATLNESIQAEDQNYEAMLQYFLTKSESRITYIFEQASLFSARDTYGHFDKRNVNEGISLAFFEELEQILMILIRVFSNAYAYHTGGENV